MSNRYKIKHQRGLYYLTLTVKGWVDVFSRQRYRDIILESFRYCKEHKGLHVYAEPPSFVRFYSTNAQNLASRSIYGYVIMTNHIHLSPTSQNKPYPPQAIFPSPTTSNLLKNKTPARSIPSKIGHTTSTSYSHNYFT